MEAIAIAKVPVCSFQPKLHTEYAAIKAQCEPWMLAVAEPQSPEAVQFLCDCLFPLLCSMIYVQCPADRVARITKMMTWVFFSDDEDDHVSSYGSDVQQLQGRHDLTLACFAQELDANTRMLLTKKMSALHELWKSISIDMPSSMQLRFRETMATYLSAVRVQAKYHGGSGSLPRVDEYVNNIRRYTVGMFPFYVLLEYGLGIELDAEVLASTMLEQVHHAVVDQIGSYNDIVSSPVEMYYGNNVTLPYIILQERLAKQPEFTLADALEEGSALAEQKDQLCVKLLAEARQSSIIKKPGVQAYLQGLEFSMGAVAHWSLKTARYNKVLVQ